MPTFDRNPDPPGDDGATPLFEKPGDRAELAPPPVPLPLEIHELLSTDLVEGTVDLGAPPDLTVRPSPTGIEHLNLDERFDAEVSVHPELLMDSAQLLEHVTQQVQKRLAELPAGLAGIEDIAGRDEFGTRFAKAFREQSNELIKASHTVLDNGSKLASRLGHVGKGYRETETAVAEVIDETTRRAAG